MFPENKCMVFDTIQINVVAVRRACGGCCMVCFELVYLSEKDEYKN